METESTPELQLAGANQNPDPNSKPKIVVIMGATGSGKSKLAIDLASHFPIEIINADSMQVYRGLDVLTNKVPVHQQRGVPHHLLGTVSPNVEFTAKDFRDSAIPLIDEIWSRNCLPVIVGGTNYYIQALVSRFLLDDHVEDPEANCLFDLPIDSEKPSFELGPQSENCCCTYSQLKDIDPVAANRIHPNDQRKIDVNAINQLRTVYTPIILYIHMMYCATIADQAISEFICASWNTSKQAFPGEHHAGQNWGRADNLRYDCCFICLDASLPALDQYVNQRVDLMVSAGLLEEVREIYKLNADYTCGLRQAIGVREFEDFLKYWNSEFLQSSACPELFNENICQIMDSTGDDQKKQMLKEAIEKVKLNTRRLVRRQKRRFGRLQMLFGWSIHFIDVTSCLLCDSDNIWAVEVVEPSVNIIKSFLNENCQF
ncbi:UNVERIFIED_CONTAM: tRNA dimethylallyltransferase 2 [Sesamum angustifolium]|uniref:tRNA dimethylallyltransferase 2 n=1 Tax=Sesamum angustifolium TaxID=2727405 RepID=A0AAW2QNP9_9LAMI